jgi:hypothetical protein
VSICDKALLNFVMNCHPIENATVHSDCFDFVQNSSIPNGGFCSFLGMSSNDTSTTVPAGYAMVPIDSLNRGNVSTNAGSRNAVKCFRCGGDHYLSNCHLPDQRSLAEKELAARKKLEKMNETGVRKHKRRDTKYSRKIPKKSRKVAADESRRKRKHGKSRSKRYESSGSSS